MARRTGAGPSHCQACALSLGRGPAVWQGQRFTPCQGCRGSRRNPPEDRILDAAKQHGGVIRRYADRTTITFKSGTSSAMFRHEAGLQESPRVIGTKLVYTLAIGKQGAICDYCKKAPVDRNVMIQGKPWPLCKAHADDFERAAGRTPPQQNPRRRNPDEQLRDLERAASLGDPIAQQRLADARRRAGSAPRPATFKQASQQLMVGLQQAGWSVSPQLKIPHATSPDGKVRIWFKPQALWVSPGTDFKHARSMHVDMKRVDVPGIIQEARRGAQFTEDLNRDFGRQNPLASEGCPECLRLGKPRLRSLERKDLENQAARGNKHALNLLRDEWKRRAHAREHEPKQNPLATLATAAVSGLVGGMAYDFLGRPITRKIRRKLNNPGPATALLAVVGNPGRRRNPACYYCKHPLRVGQDICPRCSAEIMENPAGYHRGQKLRRSNRSHDLKLPSQKVRGVISLQEAYKRNIPGIREAYDRFKLFHGGAEPSGDVIIYDDGRPGNAAGFLIGRSPEVLYQESPQGSDKSGSKWTHATKHTYLVHIPIYEETKYIGSMKVKDWLRQ